jgi:hypothetical protein
MDYTTGLRGADPVVVPIKGVVEASAVMPVAREDFLCPMASRLHSGCMEVRTRWNRIAP